MSNRPGHLPPWFTVRVHSNRNYTRLRELLKRQGLNTVCQGARCPNIWECWNSGTATFMILGGRCTRNCAFCGVPPAERPLPADPDEAGRVAEAVEALGLDWAVLTSVTRDDLPDGGAAIFAACVRAIRALRPECGVEVLTPDFRGDPQAVDTVLAGGPNVFAHNLETVARLYPRARPGADYARSLAVLSRAAASDGPTVKSSLMVGLGESREELAEAVRHLAWAGVRAITFGQYLPPTREHLPVERYYPPEEFAELAQEARRAGIPLVSSGPLVRSSYQAHRLAGRQQDSDRPAPAGC